MKKVIGIGYCYSVSSKEEFECRFCTAIIFEYSLVKIITRT